MNSRIPDRTIGGLPPRQPAVASQLLKQNRPPAPPRTDAPDDTEPTTRSSVGSPTLRRTSGSRTPTKKKRSAGPGKVQLGTDIPSDVRDRARAAFRAAAYFEGVRTFGDFVSNALEAEIHRLEREHNDGAPFEPIEENLPTGRRGG